MRALSSNKNHTKYPRKQKCRRSMVEPWARRERTSAPAEGGTAGAAEGQDLCAPWATSGQRQAGPLTGGGRPWVLPVCHFFCMYRSEEMAQLGY